MAATVRLSRSWADLYRHRPLFTMVYRHHPQKKMKAALPGGCPAIVGDFSCLVDVSHRSGSRTLYSTATRHRAWLTAVHDSDQPSSTVSECVSRPGAVKTSSF